MNIYRENLHCLGHHVNPTKCNLKNVSLLTRSDHSCEVKEKQGTAVEPDTGTMPYLVKVLIRKLVCPTRLARKVVSHCWKGYPV